MTSIDLAPNLDKQASYNFGTLSNENQVWHRDPNLTAVDESRIASQLLNLDSTCYLFRTEGKLGIASDLHPHNSDGDRKIGQTELLMLLPPMPMESLGDPTFQAWHNTKFSYMAGAMAGGIASEDLVIALGKKSILSSFGAGGLSLQRIESAIHQIKTILPQGPYAFNLLHSPNDPALERRTVDLYLKHKVKTVEASAFLDLTPSIVYYRAVGLRLTNTNRITIENKVIAKISRQEIASKFLQPAPQKILKQLVEQGLISNLQANLASRVPMADDITVEADSGGHTDNRPLVCLLPSILTLRDAFQERERYETPVRVGAAGGIGTPQSALAAFVMGAAYVVTGSVNQSCVEAGTSLHAKQLLAQAEMADVMMAPAGDMFEMGVKLQVLKRGTLFPMRAQQLSEFYKSYDSIEAIPLKEREKLERYVFKQSLESVWESTVKYLVERNPKKLVRANENPKTKMALIFRWYLGLSSRWSSAGVKDREMDYQIWCGPAMGAFNDWVRGSYLEHPSNRKVVDIARHIMKGAAYLYRLQMLKLQHPSIARSIQKYCPLHMPKS